MNAANESLFLVMITDASSKSSAGLVAGFESTERKRIRGLAHRRDVVGLWKIPDHSA